MQKSRLLKAKVPFLAQGSASLDTHYVYQHWYDWLYTLSVPKAEWEEFCREIASRLTELSVAVDRTESLAEFHRVSRKGCKEVSESMQIPDLEGHQSYCWHLHAVIEEKLLCIWQGTSGDALYETVPQNLKRAITPYALQLKIRCNACLDETCKLAHVCNCHLEYRYVQVWTLFWRQDRVQWPPP